MKAPRTVRAAGQRASTGTGLGATVMVTAVWSAGRGNPGHRCGRPAVVCGSWDLSPHVRTAMPSPVLALSVAPLGKLLPAVPGRPPPCLRARAAARNGRLRGGRVCSPGPGARRARARRPGRTVASPSAPGLAVPRPAAARDAAPGRAAVRYPAGGADLTWRTESALDGAGPGRQASPSCSPARKRAENRGGSSTAPPAAAREPCVAAGAVPDRRTPAGPWRAPAGRRLP